MKPGKAALPAIRPKTARGKGLSLVTDVFTFLIAVGASFVFKVGGELPVANFLLVPALPILLVTRGFRLKRAMLGRLLVLLALWLFGEMVADVYNHSAQVDWMRADARIVFWAIDLVGLAALLGGNARRQVVFFAGYALGLLLQPKLAPNAFTDFWKFGYGNGVTYAAVLVSCYFYTRRRQAVVALLLLAIAAVHAAFDYRSQLLFLFITVILVTRFIPERIGRLNLMPASPGKRVLVLLGLAVVAGEIAGTTITFLASHEYLGEAAYVKNKRESGAKGGLLIGGRPEILVSSRAVMASPFIGYGGWAKDWKYAEMYHDVLIEYNVNEHESGLIEEQGAIPVHSHIMEAWVDAGILGAVFWGYLLFLTGKGLIRVAVSRFPLSPLYIYSLVSFLWAIWFSPAGGVTILPECCLIIMICDVLDATPGRKGKSEKVYLVKWPNWASGHSG